MEECESPDSEVTELREFMSQDDEDEVEELQNRFFTHTGAHKQNTSPVARFILCRFILRGFNPWRYVYEEPLVSGVLWSNTFSFKYIIEKSCLESVTGPSDTRLI